MGTQLLYRTTRRLTLTEAGKALKQAAINVRDTAQEATFGLSLLIERVVSTVTVSMSLSKPITEKPLNALGSVSLRGSVVLEFQTQKNRR